MPPLADLASGLEAKIVSESRVSCAFPLWGAGRVEDTYNLVSPCAKKGYALFDESIEYDQSLPGTSFFCSERQDSEKEKVEPCPSTLSTQSFP